MLGAIIGGIIAVGVYFLGYYTGRGTLLPENQQLRIRNDFLEGRNQPSKTTYHELPCPENCGVCGECEEID